MSISFSLSFSLRESVSAFGNSIIMAFKGKDGEKGKKHTHTHIQILLERREDGKGVGEISFN